MPTTSNSVTNPLADQFNVVVSIPQAVKIKLVDASLLNDFEIWTYISTILMNFSTGFWVAFVQCDKTDLEKILLWISICFTILFTACLIIAIIKRIKMSRNSKEVELNTVTPNPKK